METRLSTQQPTRDSDGIDIGTFTFVRMLCGLARYLVVLQEKLVIETTYTQFGYHRLGIKYRLSLLGMSVAPLIYLNNRIPMTVPHLQVVILVKD